MRKRGDIKFTFPLDGVMLTDAAGEKTDEGLLINAWVDAPGGRRYFLNGAPMSEHMNGSYKCPIVIRDYKTTLELVDAENGYSQKIDVYYLKKGAYKYRFSLDDNIWFLQDLALNRDKYGSMFENPYLALIKSIHEKHGTKFHLNIYWETPRNGGFCIKDMPDRYKDEFIDNSDWIRISFHANANEPQRPYTHVSYDQMYFEAERINKEIVRFAGEQTFSKTVCTIHWGDVSTEGAKALRDLGYKAFVTTFNWNRADGVDLRSYLGDREVNILQKYGFWYDKEYDIYHFRYNDGIQRIPPSSIYRLFDDTESSYPLYRFKDICLHEQYFYPDYSRHQPNYFEKMDTACSWCDEHGYKPIFMDELFEFNTH